MEYSFDTRDEFRRKPIATKLIQLIDSELDTSPMLIDGVWGTGKTEFCLKLKELIDSKKENAYQTIYINAFNEDYIDDPLLTLLSAIIQAFDNESVDSKDFKQTATKLLKTGSKVVLKATVSYLTKQSVDSLLEDAEDDTKKLITDGSEELLNKSVEKVIDHLLEERAAIESSIMALRIELQKHKNLIIIIDELDRCRPNYAIKMLEVVKHIFDTDGVQIIFVANMQMLEASICHIYGNNMNSEAYLEKFYKLKTTLPHRNINGLTSYQYFNQLITNNNKQFSELEIIHTASSNAFQSAFLLKLFTVHQISLRQVEHIVRLIQFINEIDDQSLLHRDKYDSLRTGALFLLFISVLNPKLFEKINLSHDFSTGYDQYKFTENDTFASGRVMNAEQVNELNSHLKNAIFYGNYLDYEKESEWLNAMTQRFEPQFSFRPSLEGYYCNLIKFINLITFFE